MSGHRHKRGFTILFVAVTLPVLAAMLGLAADVGRVYVAKGELQKFVDSAALAACYELDGTQQGLANARAVAWTGPGSGAIANNWDFETKAAANVQSAFATSFAGPYVENPSSAPGYRFVEVTLTAQVPLYFLPILPGTPATQTVAAAAVAGQAIQTSLGDGLAPFSPDAHDPSAPNFGFTPGQQYTLKWPPPGQRGAGNTCAGDEGFTPGGGSSERGYIDVGQGSGNSALHDAVVNNDFQLAEPLGAGSVLNNATGDKHVAPAVEERFNQDTDTSAVTYSAYRGNGRRILVVAVNRNDDPATVAGFAAFFLPPHACGHQNNRPCCGEYIGAAVAGGKQKAAGPSGLYTVKLFR